jgi:hypothetical protein
MVYLSGPDITTFAGVAGVTGNLKLTHSFATRGAPP